MSPYRPDPVTTKLARPMWMLRTPTVCGCVFAGMVLQACLGALVRGPKPDPTADAIERLANQIATTCIPRSGEVLVSAPSGPTWWPGSGGGAGGTMVITTPDKDPCIAMCQSVVVEAAKRSERLLGEKDFNAVTSCVRSCKEMR